jgi:CheY-like chemotaxis protein
MKKVMIVEDELIIQMVTKQVVQEAGFAVCAVTATGEEAIDLAKECNPDVILMDIKLEGDLDGIDAMNKIREFSDVPVIYVTGNSDSYHKKRAAETKMFGFLVKPVDFGELINTIKKCCGI